MSTPPSSEADVLDAGLGTPDVDPKRSHIMRSVGRENTGPELTVRRFLHRHGFRFKLHDRSLPGSPDVVLPKWRTVVFVHGCYWHRHPGCRKATTPKTRTEFWQAKFDRNVERDAANVAQLQEAGWDVVTVWECEAKGEGSLGDALSGLFAKRELSSEART